MDIARCRSKGCPATAAVCGLCTYHYALNRKLQTKEKCSVDGCSGKVYCKGLCPKHYAADYSKRLKRSKAECGRCKAKKVFRSGLCWKCYDQDRRKEQGMCLVTHCGGKAMADGLCHVHKKRQEKRRAGEAPSKEKRS